MAAALCAVVPPQLVLDTAARRSPRTVWVAPAKEWTRKGGQSKHLSNGVHAKRTRWYVDKLRGNRVDAKFQPSSQCVSMKRDGQTPAEKAHQVHEPEQTH